MSSSSATKRKRGVRVLGYCFLGVFLLLCLASLLGYLAYNGKPEYYTDQQARINAMSDEERETVSTSIRNHVLTEWSAVDEDTPFGDQDAMIGQRRTFEIPYEDLNVWLAEEGIDLLAEVGIRMPKSVKSAMVDAADDGLLRISCDFDNGKMQQVVALVFTINVSDDGTVVSTLEKATTGRLPLPTQTAIDLIAKRSSSSMMLDMMQGTPAGPIQLPIDASEDGLRDGRLVGLEIREDAMVITRETVRRKKAK